MSSATILVAGKTGQLATALAQLGHVGRYEFVCAGRPELDLTDAAKLCKVFERTGPVLVINAAGYTAVDQAETEPDAAFAVNADGPGALARLCAQRHIPMIHISTDYVFDGAASQPYKAADLVSSASVYGRSKIAGEEAVRSVLNQHLILRTSWLFDGTGRNFLTTMLRLAEGAKQLGIVNDQTGSPTYAVDLAAGVAEIAAQAIAADAGFPWGTYHLCGTGVSTWHEFAREIFDCLPRDRMTVPAIAPITSADYPTAAARPLWSVLDCSKTEAAFGVRLPDWRDATRRCVTQYLRDAA